jgi:hypothetical protein
MTARVPWPHPEFHEHPRDNPAANGHGPGNALRCCYNSGLTGFEPVNQSFFGAFRKLLVML